MTPEVLVKEIRASKEYLDRSTRVLQEADSTFRPADGALTTAQQIAHIAQTVEWFIEGAFGNGFDMDFENHLAEVNTYTSLAKARSWADKSFNELITAIESKKPAELLEPIRDPNLFTGEPKLSIVYAVVEHTAHHRGALTIYSRLLGYTPPLPYMETEPAQR